MKRVALIAALTLSIASAFAQSTTMHMSGGDGTSWALIRVSGGGVAQVGDMDGIHIGEVKQDELIIVRSHKAYVVTDPKVLNDIDTMRGPLDKLRDERLKLKSESREVRSQQRSLELERRSVERDKSRMERDAAREGANRQDIDRHKADLDRKLTELETKIADIGKNLDSANKKVDAIDKERDAARAVMTKKLEKLFDDVIAKGIAKPFGV
jgi:septal ring factor EnvC (AmiA/AmiB activator)